MSSVKMDDASCRSEVGAVTNNWRPMCGCRRILTCSAALDAAQALAHGEVSRSALLPTLHSPFFICCRLLWKPSAHAFVSQTVSIDTITLRFGTRSRRMVIPTPGWPDRAKLTRFVLLCCQLCGVLENAFHIARRLQFAQGSEGRRILTNRCSGLTARVPLRPEEG